MTFILNLGFILLNLGKKDSSFTLRKGLVSMIAHPQQNSSHGTYVNDRPCTGSVIGESSPSNGGPRPLQGGLTPPIGREHPPIGGANPLPRAGLPSIGGTPPPLAASQAGKSTKWEGLSTKLAAGLRSVARNYKATRLLTRPG